MAQLPFLPFYFNDFIGSTRTWSKEERWTYLMLLIEQWENGHIPGDMPRLCRIDPDADRFWNLIGPKFDPMPDKQGYLQNLRLEEIRKEKFGYSQSFSQSQSEKAKKRWDKVRVDTGDMPGHIPKDMPNTSLHMTSDIDNDIELNLDIKKSNTALDLVQLVNSTLGRKYQVTKTILQKWGARLKEGYTIDDIRTALTNAIASPFHKEKGYTYLTPEFFTRADMIEKWKHAGKSTTKTDFTQNDYSNDKGSNATV